MTTITAPPAGVDLASVLGLDMTRLTAAAPPKPVPPKPTPICPIVTPTNLAGAIETVVAQHMPGDGKAVTAETIMALPTYGAELVHARAAIGDQVDFGTASVSLDGYGNAATIWFDAAYPVWDER